MVGSWGLLLVVQGSGFTVQGLVSADDISKSKVTLQVKHARIFKTRIRNQWHT